MPQHLYEEKCDELSASRAEGRGSVPRRSLRKLLRVHNLQVFREGVASFATPVVLDSFRKEISVLLRSPERIVLPGKILVNLKNRSTGCLVGRKLERGIHTCLGNIASTTNASQDGQ